MEKHLENGKIINKKIPEVLEYSDQHRKEMKKLIRLNNIFSEFENKASKEFNFFIDESNRRYSQSKYGADLNGVISSTRKKCLDESKKILHDDFYNNNIIKRERDKMKHNNNKILYKNLRYSMNIVKNPELINSNINALGNRNGSFIKKLLKIGNNNNKKNDKRYNFNYNSNDLNKNERIMNVMINEEQNSIEKSINNYKSNLDKLKENVYNNQIIDKKKSSSMHKKLNLYLPNLKFINYHAKKENPKNNDRDDPAKKADIHKLLPFSKLGQLNTDNNINSQPPNSRNEENKKRIFPYITEPSLPSNGQPPKIIQYYKDYQDTLAVVADSANKELYVDKNYDAKRGEVENILKVDEIPKVELYDELAREKTNKIKEDRRNRNSEISKRQNYLKLTNIQKMNLDIEKNIDLIKSIEECLYNKNNKSEK
jgi:hypothetical protein